MLVYRRRAETCLVLVMSQSSRLHSQYRLGSERLIEIHHHVGPTGIDQPSIVLDLEVCYVDASETRRLFASRVVIELRLRVRLGLRVSLGFWVRLALRVLLRILLCSQNWRRRCRRCWGWYRGTVGLRGRLRCGLRVRVRLNCTHRPTPRSLGEI